MNVVQLLQGTASRLPDRCALVSGLGSQRRSLSYGELLARVASLRLELAEQGLRPGDRVLLAVPLSIETYIALIASLSQGLVVMYVDPGHGLRAVTRCLRAYAPRGILASSTVRYLVAVVPELRRIPLRVVIKDDCRGRPRLQAPELRVQSRSNADGGLLTFTSGSTGEPKAVLRSHGFLQQQLKMLEPLTAASDIDSQVVTMPMFVLSNLVQGITSILPACDLRQPSAINFRVLWQQLEQESAAGLLAAPALVDGLIRYVALRGKQLGSLREIATGGGPVNLSLPAEVCKIAPGCKVKIVYGSTEAEPISTFASNGFHPQDVQLSQNGGGLLVGSPVDGCRLAIVKDNGIQATSIESPAAFTNAMLPAGEIGEIIVSGKHVLEGYLDPRHNRINKIRVGKRTWHRTGDAGYLDSRGRLWLVGRCKTALRDSSGTVYPFQVEIPAMCLPGVKRAALLNYGGQRVLVIETLEARKLTPVLARWSVLREERISKVVTLRKIPMDRRHNSKVDYGRLEEILDGQLLPFRERILRILGTFRRGLISLRRARTVYSLRSNARYKLSRR